MEIKKVTRVIMDQQNCLYEIWCGNSIVYSAAAPVIESVEPLIGVKVGDYVLLNEHENATTLVYEAVALGWTVTSTNYFTRFKLTDYPGEDEFTIPELKVSKGITIFVTLDNGKWKMLCTSQSRSKAEKNVEFASRYGASEATIKQIEKQNEVNQILSERRGTHGEFSLNSQISQSFKQIVRDYDKNLSLSQKESLDMILHKIARILAGNPDHVDHWDDISGYATLVSKELRQCRSQENSK